MSDFDIKQLEKYVKLLTDNYKLKIDDLSNYPSVNNSYHTINSMIQDSFRKNNIVDIILRQYRPSQIVPETVGSFLFGCFQQTYGDIPSECSPLCAYSISNNNSTTLERCNSQIHIQYLDYSYEMNNVRFIKLGRSESNQGYIFVNLNFMGFTHEEKEYFRENGLIKVQVLVTKDSKHHTIFKMRDLNDIPIIEHTKMGQEYLISDNINSESEFEYINSINSDDNSYVYIILAIIIVSIVVMSYNK